jgi:hypothetical protein
MQVEQRWRRLNLHDVVASRSSRERQALPALFDSEFEGTTAGGICSRDTGYCSIAQLYALKGTQSVNSAHEGPSNSIPPSEEWTLFQSLKSGHLPEHEHDDGSGFNGPGSTMSYEYEKSDIGFFDSPSTT